MVMLYMEEGIPVNSAPLAGEETWFELIGNAGRTFSFIQATDRFAEATGTELCKGQLLIDGGVAEEIADVQLDCAGTYPLAM